MYMYGLTAHLPQVWDSALWCHRHGSGWSTLFYWPLSVCVGVSSKNIAFTKQSVPDNKLCHAKFRRIFTWRETVTTMVTRWTNEVSSSHMRIAITTRLEWPVGSHTHRDGGVTVVTAVLFCQSFISVSIPTSRDSISGQTRGLERRGLGTRLEILWLEHNAAWGSKALGAIGYFITLQNI